MAQHALPHISCFSSAYRDTRALTEQLAAPLSPEDAAAQAMPDASPAKWHLAHTSWFFETFLLAPYLAGYQPFNPAYGMLFNSYYQSVGPQFTRAQRGMLTRPGLSEIYDYRRHVDAHMAQLLHSAPAEVAERAVLGLHHEQQHQELLLTDIKYLFSLNPLAPAYRPALCDGGEPPALGWAEFDEGVYAIGDKGEDFAFDNERPRHKVYLQPFALASRLVTNGEYLAFMEDGGYSEPRHWLSDGWARAQKQGWRAPLYWHDVDGAWQEFTLSGIRPVALAEPVCHISFYEASAYAAWAGKRLPAEAEWEIAAQTRAVQGNFLAMDRLHPRPAATTGLTQLFGDAWEWTGSAYLPYPGYAPPEGAIGEYNGKFMSGQMILRGGSCLTPAGHMRASYRNFFPPAARWQCAGLRLADDRV